MIEDKSIDLKMENRRLENELSLLRQKNEELKEDRDYIKSLLDTEFERKIKLSKENEQLKNKLKEYEILAKQMDLQTGSIAYLRIISLDYPNTVLYIQKDEKEIGTVKIYVKKDCNELMLKAFMKNIPLGVKCKIIRVTAVKTEIIKEELKIMTKERFVIDDNIDVEDKVQTYELHIIRDTFDDTFYIIADSFENVNYLIDKLNKLEGDKNDLY